MKSFNYKHLILTLIGIIMIYSFIYRMHQFTPEEYILSVNDLNGQYISNKKFRGYNFIVQYTPESYLAIRANAKIKNDLEFNLELNKYKGTKNFIFQLESSKNNDILKALSTSEEKYNNLLEYLSFEIKNDLFLCFKNDTIKCLYSNYERVYNIAPYIRVQFGFKLDSLAKYNFEKSDEFSVMYDATKLQHGHLFFNFDGTKVNKLPILKY